MPGSDTGGSGIGEVSATGPGGPWVCASPPSIPGATRLPLFLLARVFSLFGLQAQEAPRAEVTELLDRAQTGKAEAQHNLGMRAAYGMGMERDEDEAMRWYRKAAAQGSAEAKFNLGSMYDNGQGVARDLVQAYAWFTLSQRAGSAPAAEYMRRSARSLDAEERARATALARDFALRYRPPLNRP